MSSAGSGSRPAARQPLSAEKPISILIVEDNPGDLTILRQTLASVPCPHFEITHAATLSSGLEQLRYGMDVILLDLNLPDSHGLDTLQRFRASAPSIPIIIVTGTEDPERMAAALASGAQAYLVKEDLDGAQLWDVILRCQKLPEPC